ncbi:MAG: response regulator [Ignavibacteriaceae bacterium]
MDDKMKVVLAEDELITALDIKQHLKREFNAEVITTNKGGDIAPLTIDHKPDIIISDIKLIDNTNGIDAVKKLKKEYDVPVIFVSAYTMAYYLEQISRIPNAFILPKPLNFNLFYSLVKSLIKN